MEKTFEFLHKFFIQKTTEATLLADTSQKLVNQTNRLEGEEYNSELDNMRVKNMGWGTLDMANIAGGVEENRDLTSGEIISFYKSLAEFLGE